MPEDRSVKPGCATDEAEHCAHSWTHDRCCWCGAIWGEGGKKYVPAEGLDRAVAALVDIAGGGVGMARTSSAPAFAQAALRDLGVDPFTYRRARKEALRDA